MQQVRDPGAKMPDKDPQSKWYHGKENIGPDRRHGTMPKGFVNASSSCRFSSSSLSTELILCKVFFCILLASLEFAHEHSQSQSKMIVKNKRMETYLGWFADFLTDNLPFAGFIFFDGIEEGGALLGFRILLRNIGSPGRRSTDLVFGEFGVMHILDHISECR